MPAIGEARTEGGRVVKGNYVTIKVVAERLKVTKTRIIRWIRTKKVKDVKLYKNVVNQLVIEEEDIEKLKDYLNSLKPQN